jgi:hypothetical protein
LRLCLRNLRLGEETLLMNLLDFSLGRRKLASFWLKEALHPYQP